MISCELAALPHPNFAEPQSHHIFTNRSPSSRSTTPQKQRTTESSLRRLLSCRQDSGEVENSTLPLHDLDVRELFSLCAVFNRSLWACCCITKDNHKGRSRALSRRGANFSLVCRWQNQCQVPETPTHPNGSLYRSLPSGSTTPHNTSSRKPLYSDSSKAGKLSANLSKLLTKLNRQSFCNKGLSTQGSSTSLTTRNHFSGFDSAAQGKNPEGVLGAFPGVSSTSIKGCNLPWSDSVILAVNVGHQKAVIELFPSSSQKPVSLGPKTFTHNIVASLKGKSMAVEHDPMPHSRRMVVQRSFLSLLISNVFLRSSMLDWFISIVKISGLNHQPVPPYGHPKKEKSSSPTSFFTPNFDKRNSCGSPTSLHSYSSTSCASPESLQVDLNGHHILQEACKQDSLLSTNVTFKMGATVSLSSAAQIPHLVEVVAQPTSCTNTYTTYSRNALFALGFHSFPSKDLQSSCASKNKELTPAPPKLHLHRDHPLGHSTHLASYINPRTNQLGYMNRSILISDLYPGQPKVSSNNSSPFKVCCSGGRNYICLLSPKQDKQITGYVPIDSVLPVGF